MISFRSVVVAFAFAMVACTGETPTEREAATARVVDTDVAAPAGVMVPDGPANGIMVPEIDADGVMIPEREADGVMVPERK